MARIKGNHDAHKRRTKTLKLANGLRLKASISVIWPTGCDEVWQTTFVGRKQKKRQFRNLWITRINNCSCPGHELLHLHERPEEVRHRAEPQDAERDEPSTIPPASTLWSRLPRRRCKNQLFQDACAARVRHFCFIWRSWGARWKPSPAAKTPKSNMPAACGRRKAPHGGWPILLRAPSSVWSWPMAVPCKPCMPPRRLWPIPQNWKPLRAKLCW